MVPPRRGGEGRAAHPGQPSPHRARYQVMERDRAAADLGAVCGLILGVILASALLNLAVLGG